MKQYMLNIWQPVGPTPSQEVLEPIMEGLDALNKEMKDTGVWVFANGFCEPETSTVLHNRDKEMVITDGPYVEAKEYISGFTVISCPDLDAALEWGKKLARVVTLPIEVRPLRGGD